MAIELPATVTRIGQIARVHIPVAKMSMAISDGNMTFDDTTIRAVLYDFLIAQYGGWTGSLVWGMQEGVREAHMQISVSFKEKEKIILFIEFLSALCKQMNENSLYFEMGEDSFLVYPKR